MLIILGLIFLNAAVATADDADLIKKILVRDNQRIEDDAILRITRAKPGDVYDESLLSEDLQAIYNMGWFDDVRVEVEKAPEGNTVIFTVKEKPTIREIKFSGNVVLDDEELKENVDISSGDQTSLLLDSDFHIANHLHKFGQRFSVIAPQL